MHIRAGPQWKACTSSTSEIRSVVIRKIQKYDKLSAFLLQGLLSGLCGNFDSVTANDMTTSSHMEVSNAQTFGDSWALGQVWVSSFPLLPFIDSSFALFSLSVFVHHPQTHYLSTSLLPVPVSLEYTVIFKSNQTLDRFPCVCVFCILVWKRLCTWATMWRGLRETAVRQKRVRSPLQRCLCTLSQCCKCHSSDTYKHTQTQKPVYRETAAMKRLYHLKKGAIGINKGL